MPRQSILAIGLLISALALARPALAAAPETAGARPAAAADHGAEEKPNVLKFDLNLAAWSTIVFLALLFILGRFAWKPLLAAMDRREQDLEKTYHEAEQARSEGERLLAEHRRLMDEAANQVRALIEQGRREAEALKDDILRQAAGDADAARLRAEHDIEAARDRALMDIWNRAAELAVSVAGRVLEKELGPDDHRRLVEVAMNELPPAAAATNGRGGQHA